MCVLENDRGTDGLGPVEGSWLGLLALLLSFTFSMSAGKSDSRRQVIVQDAGNISASIWKRVTLLSQDKDNTLRSQQMIPALNDMIDITTIRDADRNAHVLESILWMLFLLTLAGSFVTGYGAKDKRFNFIIVLSFALMTSLTIYLILDLDRPKRGIINMDQTNNKILELRGLTKDN